ncbi:MAG: hypothetical protein AABM29_02395 [Actinomycetota bacterium]
MTKRDAMTTRLRARVGVFGGAVLLLFFAIAPAGAAKKPITGKLSKPGYTVIALGANGKGAAVRAKPKFKVKPKAKSVTLHLRAKDGTYAGPIVIAKKKKGKRAILGVKAGAKLGKVKVKARKGYAKVKRKLAKEFIDAKRRARAKKGVPIGAGKFGRVRSKKTGGGAPGDRDLDGVPAPLDIDDDGDLILDNLDRSTAARASQQVLDNALLHSALNRSLPESTNANAGSTDQQIEAALSRGQLLMIGIPSGGSAELDCGRDDPGTSELEGLSYCRPNGTGSLVDPFPGARFPECCDPDNDGFGTLVPPSVVPPASGAGAMGLVHRATTTEIKSGDVLITRVNDANGVEIGAFSHTLQYVFATVPALVSYSDTAGNSGTVGYPVAAGEPPPGPPGGPGTGRNGFPVAAGPGGDVVVGLTFWQPQRRPINGESGFSDPPTSWTDVGGLTYSARVESLNPPSGAANFVNKQCPQSAYSATPDQPLSLSPGPSPGGLTDTLADRLANPDNKLTFTLNLTQCLEGVSWNSGDTAGVIFRASAPPQPEAPTTPGSASQLVSFELQ